MADIVIDNLAQSRFELGLDGGTAVALYRLAPGVVRIYHTEVPLALRGQGIGSRLVSSVLDLVRARGQKVVPQCPFVAEFIEAHPEYRDLVAG
jgi:predicted GNAT family acetyltransferase